jgi:hypothetical protein
VDALAIHAFRSQELAHPRYNDPLRLTRFGYKAYSQNDEDGIIAEIFNRVGVANKSFIEFGVGTGVECNTIWLLMQGWSGLWMEGSEAHCQTLRTTHANWLENNALSLCEAFITAENINSLISQRYFNCEVDLLSIDIDYNDYWAWEAINLVNPRVVVIEYNATWAPPAAITVPYAPDAKWNGSNYFGASLNALANLGNTKGYELVGCCFAGANAFFVRKDLLKGKFFRPGVVAEHYEPARYHVSPLLVGHPAAVGPVVFVDRTEPALAQTRRDEMS